MPFLGNVIYLKVTNPAEVVTSPVQGHLVIFWLSRTRSPDGTRRL